MPTLFDVLTDPVSIVIFLLYGGVMGWEALRPARPLPPLPGWKWKGLLAFALYFLLATYLPFVWDDLLAPYQLMDLSGLGVLWGTVAGFLLYQVFMYAWHRSMHASDLLWRNVHQMHHSAERLDTFSAFWFSPQDMIGWTALSSLVFVLVAGFDPQAVVFVLYLTTFFTIFQHSNIRTPHWLGYLIQRPESHSRHHERGVHHGNYADLPLMDMLFGTFHNPQDFAKETGFRPGDSQRVLDLIVGKDVAGEDVSTIRQWVEPGMVADELVRKRA
jgi:sterol desaturase/sphingolipid hydroxylase (fatty acid hydroxylase superfamily)